MSTATSIYNSLFGIQVTPPSKPEPSVFDIPETATVVTPPISQYAKYGETYVPVSKIAPVLNPGVYHVGINNDNQQAHFTPKAISVDRLVNLPDSASAAVVAELGRFWGLRDTFNRLGLTHKRGVLLHGPPGSGKTSALVQVGAEVVKAGGVMFYGDAGDMASVLSQFRKVEPDRPVVVVFEDLDNILRRQGDSALLPLLDGENSVGGVVFIATTNYLNTLPPRIRCRPSRFDQVVYVGMPSDAARQAYLESRGLGIPVGDIRRLVAQTAGMPLSHLKEAAVSIYVLGNKFDDTMKRLREMTTENTPG